MRRNTRDEEPVVEKTVIRTEAAPAPFQGAPYNQAIVAGELVFVAGQLGLRPGDTAIEGDIARQTEQALANLAAILEAAGSSLDKLVKTRHGPATYMMRRVTNGMSNGAPVSRQA